MKIVELRTFLEIASLKNFNKAALSLNYAHSSITAQIKALEQDLGERLFHRGRNLAEMTEAGKRLYPYARQILELSREAREVVRSSPALSGSITIGSADTITTYRLPELLRRFQQDAPQVKISFKTMTDRELYESIKNGTVDLGFMIESNLTLSYAAVAALIDEPISLYARPDHPLAGGRVTEKDIAPHRLLLWQEKCSYRAAFEAQMKRAGFPGLIHMEMISIEAIKKCVIAGIGIALLCDVSVKREVEEGALVRLDWHMDSQFQSTMFWNLKRERIPSLNHFIQMTKDYFQA